MLHSEEKTSCETVIEFFKKKMLRSLDDVMAKSRPVARHYSFTAD